MFFRKKNVSSFVKYSSVHISIRTAPYIHGLGLGVGCELGCELRGELLNIEREVTECCYDMFISPTHPPDAPDADLDPLFWALFAATTLSSLTLWIGSWGFHGDWDWGSGMLGWDLDNLATRTGLGFALSKALCL